MEFTATSSENNQISSNEETFGVGEGMYQEESINNEEGPASEYKEIHSVLADGGDRFGVTAVHCDTQEELVWMGNQGGHVTSYYGHNMDKYTSFQVHTPEHEVRQLLSNEQGIYCLMNDKLRLQSRFGRPQWDYKSDNFVDMLCMTCTDPSKMLLGGHQKKIIQLDLSSRLEASVVEIEEDSCAIIRLSNRYICTGDTGGKVTLRDPASLSSEHTVQAHSGTLSDFDVCGNLLITCGFSSRLGNLSMDRFLMVYDLRVNRAMAPIQLSNIEPMFLRYLPGYTDRIILVSQNGQFQIAETNILSTSNIETHQVNTHGALCSSCDVSTSAQSLVFGHNSGYVHLFSTGDDSVINTYSKETEFADPLPHVQPISIHDVLTPYSMIPMQYNLPGKLVSDWPARFCKRVYRKPEPIDAEIIRSMKVVHNMGYASNSGNKHANQVPYKLANNSSSKAGKNHKAAVPDSPMGRGDDPFVIVPKKYQKVEIKYSGKQGVEDFDFRHYNKTMWAGLEPDIPNAYCNCMIQVLYYIEPLRVEMLNHICEREFCLSCELSFLFHMLDKQNGLVCQAGNFLRAFRTIPDASALNLVLSEAEEQSNRINLPRLVQNWTRFILQQLHTETMNKPAPFKFGSIPSSPSKVKTLLPVEQLPSEHLEVPADKEGLKINLEETETEPKSEERHSSFVQDLFSMQFVNTFKCRCCGNITSREASASMFNLVYPANEDEEDAEAFRFTDIMQNSLLLEQSTQTWCVTCNKYQPHLQSRQFNNIPDVIGFNCLLENPHDLEFWRTQQDLRKLDASEAGNMSAAYQSPGQNVKMCRYGKACTRKDCKFGHEPGDNKQGPDVTAEMHAMLDENQTPWVAGTILMKLNEEEKVQIYDMENVPDNVLSSCTFFDLYATVTHIRDAKTNGNLVSHIHVDKYFHRRKEGITTTQWYLFNDFSIAPIEKNEGMFFNLDWKVPCCLFYMRRDIGSRHNLEVSNPINSNFLYADASLVTPRRRLVTFTPLVDDELPKDGDLVGLDAEFVSLIQEEAELRSDGTKSTIKPSHMSVARVTCVRGNEGPLFGEPFIDDYISTQDQVVDYLTQFSGIKPGDLDATMSTKHLTTLKSTYLKLRYLIDHGVRFVGHGLKKDFRVLNLVVPQKQIVDTVTLFHQPRQRMISLKFLAWYFLGVKIQAVTHDSIEDARTALRLYQKYVTLQESSEFTQKLQEVYEKGRELKWNIPETYSSTD